MYPSSNILQYPRIMRNVMGHIHFLQINAVLSKVFLVREIVDGFRGEGGRGDRPSLKQLIEIVKRRVKFLI